MKELIEKVRDCNYYGVDKLVAEKYTETLTLHINSVVEAGEKLNVNYSQLAYHDDSKWSEIEFAGYALHFQGGGAPDEFSRAWLHHIHYNPHHWQHWMFPDNYTPKGSKVENGIVEMPQNYALEMIADWMGASYAYTNSWDMTDWLVGNIPRIKVHSETAKYLSSVLLELGYKDVIKVCNFGNNQ
jgi:hypothetical protein